MRGGVVSEAVLAINKPTGVSSREVVNRVGRVLGTKAVG
ncbi:MAG: tRNA pseudouridine(55) synthase TruB, partial [Planctomycetia bacterium]|nr:tRNA pseudouridine(55) synthase TruB [Planctomycetia bacterium]